MDAPKQWNVWRVCVIGREHEKYEVCWVSISRSPSLWAVLMDDVVVWCGVVLRFVQSVHMDDLEILILDEADRLLELGFMDEIEELIRLCPIERQTMLFSATLTSKVDQLIKLSLKRPIRISADPLFDMNKNLIQEFVRIRPSREDDREAILLALCSRTFRTNVRLGETSSSDGLFYLFFLFYELKNKV